VIGQHRPVSENVQPAPLFTFEQALQHYTQTTKAINVSAVTI